MSDRQPTTGNQQSTPDNRHPIIVNNQKPTTTESNTRHSTLGARQPTFNNQQQTTIPPTDTSGKQNKQSTTDRSEIHVNYAKICQFLRIFAKIVQILWTSPDSLYLATIEIISTSFHWHNVDATTTERKHQNISLIDNVTLTVTNFNSTTTANKAIFIYHSKIESQQCWAIKSLSNMSNNRRFCPALVQSHASQSKQQPCSWRPFILYCMCSPPFPPAESKLNICLVQIPGPETHLSRPNFVLRAQQIAFTVASA